MGPREITDSTELLKLKLTQKPIRETLDEARESNHGPRDNHAPVRGAEQLRRHPLLEHPGKYTEGDDYFRNTHGGGGARARVLQSNLPEHLADGRHRSRTSRTGRSGRL